MRVEAERRTPRMLDSSSIAAFLAGSASVTASMLLLWESWSRWLAAMAPPSATSPPGGNAPLQRVEGRRHPPGYPAGLDRAVVLRDGAHVRIRPIRPDDEGGLVDLHGRLSAQTVYQRYLAPKPRLLPRWARYFATVDYRDRMALVVERDAGGRAELVAVGQYARTEDGTADVALLVQDAWQRKGIGTILLHDLLGTAEAGGLRRFSADILADNRRMIGLLSRHTDVISRTLEHAVLSVTFAARRAHAEAHPA